MASYATVDELRAILTQVPDNVTTDAQLQTALDEATEIVDLALGFSFAAYGATATDKDIRATATGEYLSVPACDPASVAAVATVSARGETGESETTLAGWMEEDDELPVTVRLYRGGCWIRGVWYRVTAKWGYGPAPDAIKRVTKEVAVNLWGSRDSRQVSDVVGVEGGGAVGYNRELTNRQKMVVARIKDKYGELGVA